jgi:hypothetical protein
MKCLYRYITGRSTLAQSVQSRPAVMPVLPRISAQTSLQEKHKHRHRSDERYQREQGMLHARLLRIGQRPPRNLRAVLTPRVIKVMVALLDPHSNVDSEIFGLRKCWYTPSRTEKIEAPSNTSDVPSMVVS